jgi:hypothetical protein
MLQIKNYFIAAIAATALVFSTGAGAESKTAENKTYGSKLTLEKPVDLAQVLATAKDNVNKEILTTGLVKKVCKKKGCWLELQAAEQHIRVTFKDYGFFVPESLLDKTVRLQGQLVEKTYSVRDQKHFLKDEGASKKTIAAIKEPKTGYEFVASGVEVVN